MSAARVAVIGGGWAGCTAAVRLARNGLATTLVEQAPALGGRARRVDLDGTAVDNGQHLLIGAYAGTLRAIAAVHDDPAPLFVRLPLTLLPFGTQPAAVALRARQAPAPFHLALALLAARGLTTRARLQLAARLWAEARRGFRVEPDRSVAAHYADLPRGAVDGILAPLCVAALNTLPEDASAAVFGRVLAATFAGPRASDFLIPATDLGSLYPDAASRALVAAGGRCLAGTRARIVGSRCADVTVDLAGAAEHFAAVVIAVGPHQLAAVFDDSRPVPEGCRHSLDLVAGLRYEPITTVYLDFERAPGAGAPISRLDDAPGQWLFDHTALHSATGSPRAARWAVVISAQGTHERLAQDALVAAVEAQLRRLRPGLPPVLWARAITEKRATYACTPGLRRPVAGRVGAGLYLAGDYTDGEFPATLEAATRSGEAAAQSLLADLATAARRGDARGYAP